MLNLIIKINLTVNVMSLNSLTTFSSILYVHVFEFFFSLSFVLSSFYNGLHINNRLYLDPPARQLITTVIKFCSHAPVNCFIKLWPYITLKHDNVYWSEGGTIGPVHAHTTI